MEWVGRCQRWLLVGPFVLNRARRNPTCIYHALQTERRHKKSNDVLWAGARPLSVPPSIKHAKWGEFVFGAGGRHHPPPFTIVCWAFYISYQSRLIGLFLVSHYHLGKVVSYFCFYCHDKLPVFKWEIRRNSFKASRPTVLHNECLQLILWVTADMTTREGDLVKVVNTWLQECEDVFCTHNLIKMKLRPLTRMIRSLSSGFVSLQIWWSRSSRVAGPGVKTRWLSNELQMSLTIAVVFEIEALQLWQIHLESPFNKIPDMWVAMVTTPYGYDMINAEVLVNIGNMWKSLERSCIFQLSLPHNTVSLCLPAASWSYSQRCLSTPTGESSPSA